MLHSYNTVPEGQLEITLLKLQRRLPNVIVNVLMRRRSRWPYKQGLADSGDQELVDNFGCSSPDTVEYRTWQQLTNNIFLHCAICSLIRTGVKQTKTVEPRFDPNFRKKLVCRKPKLFSVYCET